MVRVLLVWGAYNRHSYDLFRTVWKRGEVSVSTRTFISI